MKRGILFIILGVLVLTFIIAQAGFIKHGKSISEEELSKVSSAVLEEVEKGDGVKVYIKLKSEKVGGRSIASENTKEEVSSMLGEKVKHKFDDKVSAFVSEEELLELQNNPEVEAVELVGIRSISLQDSVPLINTTSVWSNQLNGSNLTGEHETICIIDTGVNYTHSDLGGCFGDNSPTSSCKVIGGWDYCADDVTCTTEDSDPMDAHWHGTHVSGIASANGTIKGVAPDAKLIVIKAANSSGTFWDDDLEKAIDWCVNNASTFNISVISMSLGGGLYSSYCNDDPLNDSINNAVANNISVVVATGNDANLTHISGPACVQNATPVGGTDKSDGMYSNGNRNSIVLLLAPGVSINSTYINGAYGASSGTSMSTPHVAGAFALVNQYRRLEGSIDLTPAEIENALNDSGKIINDASSGLTFSRIKIYETILALDAGGVSVNLNSPAHNTIDSDQNQTFNCSATDIQLSNLTFYLWNCSSDLINETTYDATSNNFEISINQTLDNGTYTWNCLAYDNNTNSAWASSNYTLKIGAMGVTLNSPDDDSYTTTNSTTFNCSIQSTVANLTNVTLKIWNSTSSTLVYNTTTDISGASNETTFDYNLTAEDDYDWNCLAYDEASNSVSCTSNYTIIFDATNPVVSLESPADEASVTAGSIDFEFSVSDASNIRNCSLIIDGNIEETDTTINKDTTQTIDLSLSADDYDWRVRCFDYAGNSDDSEQRDLTVTSSSSSSDSSSSTTTTTTTTTTTVGTTYTITDSEFETGYTKELAEGDKIVFNKNNEPHTLELEEATETAIRVRISSTPITVIIYLGDVKKVDLNADNIYDIEIRFNENGETTANITIKSIDEPIGTRQIADEEGNETIGTSNETIDIKNPFDYIKSLDKKTLIIIGIVAGVVLLAGVGYFLHKRNNKILGPVFKKKYGKLKK